MKTRDLKKLPQATYFKELQCPSCGWHGDNTDDVTATFHERIEERMTDEGDLYFHCTNCGTDFVEKKEND